MIAFLMASIIYENSQEYEKTIYTEGTNIKKQAKPSEL